MSDETATTSHGQFDAILDHAVHLMCLLSPEGTVLRANRAAREGSGEGEPDIVGRPFWEAPWWRQAPELQRRVRAGLDEAGRGESVRFSITRTRNDAVIDLSLSPVLNESGTVTFVVAEGCDVTALERGRRRAEEREDRLRRILEASTDAYWDWDVLKDAIFCSDSHFRLLGIERDDVRPGIAGLKSLLHPDDESRVDEAIRLAFEEDAPFRVECRMRHRDGSYRWILVRGCALRDAHGKPCRMIGANTDVTNRKDAQERLRRLTAVLEQRVLDRTAELSESRERMRAIVDNAVEAIITIDYSGVVQSFNRAAERMFQYSADEVIGANVAMLIPSPDSEEHDNYIERYLRTGEARIIGIGRETVARRKDGSLLPIEIAISEVHRLQMFTGIIRDISERREAEERLQQADRLSSIGTLAAGLGHDMNNVLLPVRSRLDLIDHADLPPKLQEHFAEIRRSAKYLQDLADGLHLLVLDPDDPEASTRTTVLDQWWDQIHSLLGRSLPRHVRFSASLPSELPEIPVPPHRLTQAVLNMLVNSATAVGEDGRVRLWADVDAENLVVRVGLTDNGCGMTREVTRRAFEPFYTTKTRGLGTGLGLSLVHGVVHSAGGTIDVDSTPGKGTTIIMKFPAAARGPADRARDGVESPRRAVASVRDRRMQSLIENLLEMAGFDVDAGKGGVGGDHALWVTDLADRDPATVRECIERTGKVIILGPAEGVWDEPNVVVIDDPGDFDKLRAAIDRAAEGVSG